MTAAAPVFRFEHERHEYFLDDVQIPSITQLIKMGDLLGKGAVFYTEAHRRRGQEIHRLCADHDLGALDLSRFESPFRSYVLAYVAACQQIKPTWDAIEEFEGHPQYKFGGRLDRVGRVFGLSTVVEIKSGVKAQPSKTTGVSHQEIQTALQAMLASVRYGLPAERWQRRVIYVKHTGKFVVERHVDRRAFIEAKRLIREFCR